MQVRLIEELSLGLQVPDEARGGAELGHLSQIAQNQLEEARVGRTGVGSG